MKTTRTLFVATAVGGSLAIGLANVFWDWTLYLWIVWSIYLLMGITDMLQKKHTILRLYPVLGRLRYFFEAIRPEMQQYFVEDDTNGMPVSREFRSLIYQRAKGVRDTRPFGTIFDTYRVGYEWTDHSMNPKPMPKQQTREKIGALRCEQPYEASRFNISAMSYGALSKHAIRALNRGAKLGRFYHNTGEGGLSPYHLEEGGDLVWQIGTGYFSCRTPEGEFDSESFARKAQHPAVKMIEIKLSQGAKPAHGGILPAAKVTPEIAEIREVPLAKDILSPPAHTAFRNPTELLQFVTRLRELSGSKPVGIKLSIGKEAEFLSLCKAMLATGLMPDFITVDGAEGGTGAAPIEFTNSVGTPLRDALHFVHSALIGCGLRDQVHVIASGKAFSAFHVFRLLALGADLVNSARGMMFALGCIQSRQCHSDTCPTGVATQDPKRYKHLDISDKAKRVANYQVSVIHHLMELVAATGLHCPSQIQPSQIKRRVSPTQVCTYETIYPLLENGQLLDASRRPDEWAQWWQQANPKDWPES
ncbi:MAG: FMN-binding glutamate synthase family protein [Hydrogenovibrio sp.]